MRKFINVLLIVNILISITFIIFSFSEFQYGIELICFYKNKGISEQSFIEWYLYDYYGSLKSLISRFIRFPLSILALISMLYLLFKLNRPQFTKYLASLPEMISTSKENLQKSILLHKEKKRNKKYQRHLKTIAKANKKIEELENRNKNSD